MPLFFTYVNILFFIFFQNKSVMHEAPLMWKFVVQELNLGLINRIKVSYSPINMGAEQGVCTDWVGAGCVSGLGGGEYIGPNVCNWFMRIWGR
jgi:hypothetical protein